MEFLSRQLNIRHTEWPRFTWLYFFSFLYVVGLVWSTISLNAAFLEQVGPAYLPHFFVAKAILSLPAVTLYTAVADRWSPDRLFIFIFTTSLAALFTGLIVLRWGRIDGRFVYPFLYLIMFVPLGDIQAVHWYTYVTDFYDTRAAKRIIPVLVTAFGVASVAGGESVNGLVVMGLNTPQVVLLSSGLLALSALLIWLMPRVLPRDTAVSPLDPALLPGAAEDDDKSITAYLKDVREGYHFVKKSAVLRVMAAATLILMLLFPLAEYVANQTLAVNLTEAGITAYLGRVTSLTNLILLPLQFFWLNRLVTWLGLGNANLIFPLTTLVTAGALFFVPGALWPAALVLANQIYVYTAVGYPLNNLLYNAVPARVKGRARAFVGGLVAPVGMLLGSVGLLLMQSIRETPPYLALSITIFILALLFGGVSLLIRRRYGEALVTLLAQEDYSSLLTREASKLTVSDPAALDSLQQKLAESPSPEFTIFMVQLISDMGGPAAAPILAEAARAESDPQARVAIAEVLAAGGAPAAPVRDLFIDWLDDPDPAVRGAALAGLAAVDGENSRTYRQWAARMVEDPAPAVRLQALPALLRAEDTPHRETAVSILTNLLQSDDPQQRVAAVRTLEQVGDPFTVRHLMRQTEATVDPVRLAAAQALETLAQQKQFPAALRADVAAAMLPLCRDPIERVRAAALRVLGRWGTADHLPHLLAALTDAARPVRETAVSTLAQWGQSVIPHLEAQRKTADPAAQTALILALGRIDPRAYTPQVEGQITTLLRQIYTDYHHLDALDPLRDHSGVDLLCHAIMEQNQRRLDDIFSLLTVWQSEGSVHLIRRALAGSNETQQANAGEALESLTSPHLTRLIIPLATPDPDPVAIRTLGAETWSLETPSTQVVLGQRISSEHTADPWLRAIAGHALGQLGAAFVPQQQKPPAPTQKKRRRPRSAADLLDALAEEDDEPETDMAAETADPPAGDLATVYHPPPALSRRLTITDLMGWIQTALTDPDEDVRTVAHRARAIIAGQIPADPTAASTLQEEILLSVIERIIFLKKVLFFQNMTVEQLKVLASVCEETFFPADTVIYQQGDPGGELYVVVSGRVAIERPARRKGSVVRLGTVDAYAYFGEMHFFTDSARDTTAVALQDTWTLHLRRDPLLALARQQPELSLEIINVLSQRLQEVTGQIADRTRSTPRELHKLFDQLES